MASSMPGLLEQVTQKWKVSHYLVNSMQAESWVKFQSAQNIFGASQQVAVFS